MVISSNTTDIANTLLIPYGLCQLTEKIEKKDNEHSGYLRQWRNTDFYSRHILTVSSEPGSKCNTKMDQFALKKKCILVKLSFRVNLEDFWCITKICRKGKTVIQLLAREYTKFRISRISRLCLSLQQFIHQPTVNDHWIDLRPISQCKGFRRGKWVRWQRG